MALFAAVSTAFCAVLEEEQKQKEYRKLARQQIIREMEKEKQKAEKLEEPIDLLSDYK